MIDRGERRAINEFRSETGAREPGDSVRRERQHGYRRSHDRRKVCGPPPDSVSWKQGRDEAGLFAFDSRLREVAPFSVDTRALKGALGRSIRSGPPRYMTRSPPLRNAWPRARWRGARWSCSPTASIPRAA